MEQRGLLRSLLGTQAATLVLLLILSATGLLAWPASVLLALCSLGGSLALILPLRREIRELCDEFEMLADISVVADTEGRSGRSGWRASSRMLRIAQDLGRRTADELAESRRVLDTLPDPVILIDERRFILWANEAAAAIFDSPPERFAQDDISQLIRAPAVLHAVDAVLAGAPARSVDFSLQQPVPREMSARIEPVSPAGSSPATAPRGQGLPEQPKPRRPVLLVLYDQTASRRMEQMRADFVANASHELKTPLASLLGFIETLRGPARDDAEARDRFLAIMQEQAGRMARLVDDLLSLSRISLHEHVLPTTAVAVGAVVRRVVDSLEVRAKGFDMPIELKLTEGLPEVAGDADELAQLFQNLLDNALKYGRRGSPVTVTAARSTRFPGGLFVSVKDEGEGIAREHLPRLTERFYRVDNARSRAMGGTGLGLAIVKHIVGRHRGLLDVVSEPGRGSCFTVHLPAAAARPSHMQQRPA